MWKYLIFICLASFCFAKPEYFDKGKEGWFYYQDPIKSVEDNRTKEDENFIASLPDDFTTMSAEEFSKAIDKVRNIAVMKPTQENITAWKRMVKFSTDQSKLFTVNYKVASIMDDSYDYTDIGSGGFSNKNMKEAKKQKEKAKYLTENIAFVTFVKDGASTLTQKQIMANMDLKRDYGVDTRTFSVEDYPEMVQKLSITNDVENFVYYKDTKQWQRIRRGLIDADTYVNDFMFFEEHKDAFKNDKKTKEN